MVPTAVLFLSGFLAGLALWDRISLPVDNPWGVVGLPAVQGFHPANNIVRFLVLIACPTVALLLAHAVRRGRFSAPQPPETARPPGRAVHAALLVGLAVLAALNLPTYHAWGDLNRFHEGESLGTAVSHLHGQIPYRDYLFVHGVYQDPLRSALAFRWLGRSIGSARALESAMKMVAFALLGLVLWEWFGRRATPAFGALLIIVALHGLVALEAMWLPLAPLRLMPRDATALAFLLALVRLYRRPEAGRPAWFVAGFVPLASFGYSIDRGFFLTATALVTAPLLWRVVRRERGFPWSFAGGAAAGVAAVGWLLQWDVREFLRFTFVIMPRYKEWMDGIAYPIGAAPMWGVAALFAANLFQLTRLFLASPVREFVQRRWLEICLLVLSLCYFRAALGRADFVHVSVNSWPVYLLAITLFVRPLVDRWPVLAGRGVAAGAAVLAAICLVQVPRAHLLAQNFPVGRPDSHYLPAGYLTAAAVIRENLAPGESFFTLTSEALWYYLVDRPCPTRFSVVWFAAPPFYQQEIIRDLERNNTTLVLYRNQAPSNRIDEITVEKRLPLVTAHVRQHYEPWRNVDGHELWKRRPK